MALFGSFWLVTTGIMLSVQCQKHLQSHAHAVLALPTATIRPYLWAVTSNNSTPSIKWSHFGRGDEGMDAEIGVVQSAAAALIIPRREMMPSKLEGTGVEV